MAIDALARGMAAAAGGGGGGVDVGIDAGTGIRFTGTDPITIINTGVTAVTTPGDNDTAEDGTIKVANPGAENSADRVHYVKVKGINNAAFKDVDTVINDTKATSTNVPTTKAVYDELEKKLEADLDTTAFTNDNDHVPSSKLVKEKLDDKLEDSLTINGVSYDSTNDSYTLDGDDIDLTGYTAISSGAEEDVAATDSVNDAVAKVEYKADNRIPTDNIDTDFPVTPSADHVLASTVASATFQGTGTVGVSPKKGLVPAPGTISGTETRFLKADGTWATPPNTEYSEGTGIDISNAGVITNTGVTDVSASDIADPSIADGTFKVVENGTAKWIPIKGLDDAAYKDVDNAITSGSTSTNLPTSQAVADFVDTTMSEALALKQDSLDNTQLAAVNSGIDSNKVGQISTNQTNILSVQSATEELVDDGAKNLFDDNNITELERLSQSGNVYTATVNDTADKFNLMGYQATPSAVVDRSIYVPNIDTNGVAFGVFTKDPSATLLIIGHSGTTINNDIRFDISSLVNGEQYVLAINITQYNPQNTLQFKDVMICTKSKFDISPAYEPHALPNYDLTQLEAEDRAALAEQVDDGAKNKLDCNIITLKRMNTGGVWNANTYLDNGGTTAYAINSDLTITCNKSDTGTGRSMTLGRYSDGADLNGMVISGGSSTATIMVQKASTPYTTYAESTGDGVVISGIPSNMYVRIVISLLPNVTCSNVVLKPMLCTLADWKISQNFTAHALPNTDLTRLEAEDRAGLVECVDGGAKNILAPTDLVPYGDGLTNNPNLTCTNNGDGTYTLNGSTVGNGRIIINHAITSAVYGGKMLSGCPNINTGSEKCRLSIYTYTGASGVCHDAGQGNEIPTSFDPAHLAIYVFSGNTFNNVKFYPMICTKAAFDVSQKFVPYQTIPKIILCKNHVFTADTTLTYTGASFVIPENTTVRITASAVSVRNQPSEIAISNYSDQNLILAHNSAVEGKTNGIITTELVYSTSGTTYTVAVLAKYAGATENQIILVVEKLN